MMTTIEKVEFRLATQEEIKVAKGSCLWQVGSFICGTVNKVLGTCQALWKGANLVDWQPPITNRVIHKISSGLGFSPAKPFSSTLPVFKLGNIHFIDNHQEVFKAVFAEHRNGELLEPSRSMKMLFTILKDIFPDEEFTLEDSILTCSPEKTAEYRQMIFRLLQGKIIKEVVKKETEAAVASWGIKGVINATGETRLLASKIITTIFLGADVYTEKLGLAVNFINSFITKSILKKIKLEDKEAYKAACGVFKEAVEAVMARRGEIPIFEGIELTPAAMKSMIFTLFFAGQETIAALLAFSLRELALDPGKQEIDTKERVNQLFVEMIHDHPSAHGVGRVIKEHACLAVTYNKKGKSITDKRIFWKGDTVALRIIKLAASMPKEGLKQTSFLPFGSGPHRCPGEKLAINEFKTVLSALTSQYNLSMERPGTNALVATVTLQLKNDVWIKLTPKD